MKKKIRVGILCGGKSAEHEVSLQSAKNVLEALDKNKYEPVLIGIGKDGEWNLLDQSRFLLNANDPGRIALAVSPGTAVTPHSRTGELVSADGKSREPVDVVFPVLHGPFGEDGTVQGLLKLFNVPFVGAGVLGSAVGMDKDVMKRLLRAAGIPAARFIAYRDSREANFGEAYRELGLPLFVKPANLGSSVGVSKVKNADQFAKAVKEAFQYDRKILTEEFVDGREIECSVLGNDDPVASVAGEVISRHEFYSYEAKYLDSEGALLKIPADLSEDTLKEIQRIAVEAFKVLCCEGMARVDFFLQPNGRIVLNEINTIPGFTKISMYPKLWEASGVSYSELVDRLIQLALARHEKEQKLKTSR